MEIKKENWYVCTESLEYRNCIYKKGGLYQSSEDGYLNDENGVSNSFCWSGKHYFRPATSDEILIGRALTEEQQLLVKELKLKIELAKIEFMKCGLSEEQALAQVDLVVKNAIREVYHPKK
jgi:hypothetical protein